MKRPCIHILRHWRECFRWGKLFSFSTSVQSQYQVDLVVQSRMPLQVVALIGGIRPYKYLLSGNMVEETRSFRGGTPPLKVATNCYPSDGVVYMAYRKYRFTTEEPPEWTVLIDKR